MKTKITLLVLSSSLLFGQTISIKNGWQNIGATEDINASTFDNKCVDYLWRYDATGQWKLHIANGVKYTMADNYESINLFNKADGFWVKGNNNCLIEVGNTITTEEDTSINNVIDSNSSAEFFAQVSCPPTLPDRGTDVLHVCDCQEGADESCVAGNDNNDGTATSPKQTLSSAIDALNSGQSVAMCRGGAWIQDTSFRFNAGVCSVESPCEIQDYGDSTLAQPLLQQTVDESGIEFDPGDTTTKWKGININNLHLKKTNITNQGAGIFIFRDISNVHVQCTEIDGFGLGMYINNTDINNTDITLKNSYIHNNTVIGWLGGANNAIVEGNHFDNNGYLNASMFQHNMYVSGLTENMVVRNNKLTKSAVDDNGQCIGVSLNVHSGITNNLLIENNIIEETNASAGCWGLMVDAAGSDEEKHTNAIIRGNIVKNVGNQAIGIASCIDCKIENNVIIQENMPGSIGIASPNRTTLAPDADVTGTIVRNNTVYFGDKADGIAYYVGERGENYIINNNIAYYTNTLNSNACFNFDLPSSAYSLVSNNLCYGANFDIGTTGMDINAITSDPLFVNTPYDFHLQSSSPAINSGYTTFGSGYDIEGKQRDSSPDIGAYEY
jgi:hypothetical protein